ncbi:unnamed protein product [Kuraishia capsulata CBS 1993]|uniref:Ribosomal protein L22 n=1 Tax=Kuraishia capsulata CBS 1993 TaxID=1382522 RepID=W6MR54_9ASCO|nr:uncharacterized protein KUCA_T00004823001 [Kuraishia capsulata CBS 1993]CDK28838.1 unnamed protein product [Kuraishia capsulata CBS 1993]
MRLFSRNLMVARPAQRFFATSPLRLNDSLFGSLGGSNKAVVAEPTQAASVPQESAAPASDVPAETSDPSVVKYLDPAKDAALQEYLNPAPMKTVETLLSPLKREIYEANVKRNGFFKNGEVEVVNGETYKLQLSKPEIEALEPSIYLKSWRIKYTPKKTNIVLRALKDLPLKKAITQVHFINKKVTKDLDEMLTRGVEHAKRMNYDPNDMYVAESWVGSDGEWVNRPEFKGRGRVGILTHRYVNIRILLKSKQTQARLNWERLERLKKKAVKTPLPNLTVRGPAPGFYKW